jgi:shikimate kinase
MSVVLIGYRASGKTTVGRMVAERLGHGFADSDDWIVRRAGRPIRQIFAEMGEAGFRDLESAAVREIALLDNHILAVGGGALGRPENVSALKERMHRFVYLRCQPSELLRRIEADPASSTARPALSHLGGGIEEIEMILAQREPLWRSVMHAELDVSDLSLDEAAAAVMKLV